LERGKKKASARKERGRSQRKTLLNREDAKSAKKIEFLCVFVSPWLSESFMVSGGFDTPFATNAQGYSTTELG